MPFFFFIIVTTLKEMSLLPNYVATLFTVLSFVLCRDINLKCHERVLLLLPLPLSQQYRSMSQHIFQCSSVVLPSVCRDIDFKCRDKVRCFQPSFMSRHSFEVLRLILLPSS